MRRPLRIHHPPARLAVGMLGLCAGLQVMPARLRAATPPGPTPPSESAPEAARKARQSLHELDRFLDHHPLLEDDLRGAPHLATDLGYLKANPELRDFLVANPSIIPALALEPRHFLHRALMIQASGPVRWLDLAQLDSLFDQEPTLERELRRNPELIHDETFLHVHAALREFLASHAPLGRVFLAAKN